MLIKVISVEVNYLRGDKWCDIYHGNKEDQLPGLYEALHVNRVDHRNLMGCLKEELPLVFSTVISCRNKSAISDTISNQISVLFRL